MEQINQSIAHLLLNMGIDKENIDWSSQILLVLGIILISYIITKLFKHLVIPVVQKSQPKPRLPGTITSSMKR